LINNNFIYPQENLTATLGLRKYTPSATNFTGLYRE
jgi:hypothetical protein